MIQIVVHVADLAQQATIFHHVFNLAPPLAVVLDSAAADFFFIVYLVSPVVQIVVIDLIDTNLGAHRFALTQVAENDPARGRSVLAGFASNDRFQAEYRSASNREQN